MDKSQPETQSSRFLDDCARRKCIISVIIPFASDTAQIGRMKYTLKPRLQMFERVSFDAPRSALKNAAKLQGF
jgi:hypothetical protein